MNIKGDRGLRTVCYILTVLFIVAILCPMLILLTYSMRDSTAIYQYPPNLLPSVPRSVSIVIDYSAFTGESGGAVQDKMLQDSAAALYETQFEMKKSSLGEVKVYGVMNGNTVFYQRAHTMALTMQTDYGVLKSVWKINRSTLNFNGRYKQSAEILGYEFNAAGLDRRYDAANLNRAVECAAIPGFLLDESKDRGLHGTLVGSVVAENAMLWPEFYYYYVLVPSYLYNTVPSVARLSFLAFLFNTLLTMAFAMVAQVGLCSLTAYPLSRLFPKRTSKILMFYFLVTMMIPFICILVPQMILLKSIGAMNNYAAMLLPWLCPAPFYIFLFKGFFDRLPQSLFDAIRIDGASQWYSYTRLCLPLSTPIIAVIALNTFVSAWSEFFWYQMAANRIHLWTINVALYGIAGNAATKQNISLGLAFVSMLPVIITALVFSRQIKDAVTYSGIKG